MRALASYGFIVAAPLHAGDVLTDPDCGTNNGDGIANRPADIEFVIDSLLQLNMDRTSFFAGAINPRRIGMSGPSPGGNTTLLVSASDYGVFPAVRLRAAKTPKHHRRHVPASRAYYEKKRAQGKTHNQAVRALARHLVCVLWAMFVHDRDYELRENPSRPT